jgi:hypothetical protein
LYGDILVGQLSAAGAGGGGGAQWAKTVIWRTFCHKLGKKSDRDVVEGLLEAYYKGKHKKMTKSEIWINIGGWGQKLEIGNFLLKSV